MHNLLFYVHTLCMSWGARWPHGEASAPGSSPGRGHCVVLLGKTLHSHSASLHPGAEMATGEFNAGGNPGMD